MPEIIHGPATVDDLVLYKGAGINPELIPKAAPKLLGTKEHRIPRRFYSRIRSLHILVSTTPDTAMGGVTIAGTARIIKFRDGRFTTSDRDEIAAVEGSYTYGTDVFDIDEMDKVVDERNTVHLMTLVEQNPKVKNILQAQAVDDFLKKQNVKKEKVIAAAERAEEDFEDENLERPAPPKKAKVKK